MKSFVVIICLVNFIAGSFGAADVPSTIAQRFSQYLDENFGNVAANSVELLSLQTDQPFQYTRIVGAWKKVAQIQDCSQVSLRQLINLQQMAATNASSKVTISRATYDQVKRVSELCKGELVNQIEQFSSPALARLMNLPVDQNAIDIMLGQTCAKQGFCLQDASHYNPNSVLWSQAKSSLNNVPLADCSEFLGDFNPIKLSAGVASRHTDLSSKLSSEALKKVALGMICDKLDQDNIETQKDNGSIWL